MDRVISIDTIIRLFHLPYNKIISYTRVVWAVVKRSVMTERLKYIMQYVYFELLVCATNIPPFLDEFNIMIKTSLMMLIEQDAFFQKCTEYFKNKYTG